MVLDLLSIMPSLSLVFGLISFVLILYEYYVKKRREEIELVIDTNDFLKLDENIKSKYLYVFNDTINSIIKLAKDNDIVVNRNNYPSILNQLLENGFIDNRDYFEFQELYVSRNKIAHSIAVDESLLRSDYLKLLYLRDKVLRIQTKSKFDFEEDIVGEKPNKIIVSEDEGEIIVKSDGGALNSSKYLSIRSPFGSSDYIKLVFPPKKKINLTYYVRQESYGELGVGAGLHLYEGSKEAIFMAITGKTMKYYDKIYHNISKIEIGEWYKIFVEVDCINQKFNCYINDILMAENASFRFKVNYINTIKSSLWIRQDEWETSFDEIIF